MTIPSQSKALVQVNVLSTIIASLPVKEFEGYLEPKISETTGLVVAHTVTTVKDGLTVARVLNPTGKAVELKQVLHMGDF
ncbi:hypothetical protein EYF80_056033 [Liparis tanakae]|uniref:Uncharacterized protein n=1 Tax=Liparis tanakae TaxID=230148 RepID=A0A4Z2EZJ4_9TELE|nr:hypothetical protein EYF80_056033 [Liparis tanakae]